MDAYDSTRPGLIPATAAAVLPYADGDFAWSLDSLARFPLARRRFITVFGNAQIASIFDIETGDGTPPQAPGFIRERRMRFPSTPPTIYCNRSTLPLVQQRCAGLHYYVWLATLDGTIPESISGGGELVAVQYENVGGRYDVSRVLNDRWLHPPGE
jgi:hypothetical protein